VAPFVSNLSDWLKRPENTVIPERFWCRTGKEREVLGSTLWDGTMEKPITRSSIVFNTEFYIITDALSSSWSGQNLPQSVEVVDAQSLALHELGHLVGLSHVAQDADPTSIMNPTLFIGLGMASRNISNGDRERIRSIYVPGAPPPTRPPTGEKPANNGPTKPKPTPTPGSSNCDLTTI
jgi:hypothetical protein